MNTADIISIEQRLLQSRPVLIDGGMGQELIKRGVKNNTSGLWSATALMTNPESVEAIHKDYIDAGAEVITTNTYTTLKSRLASENLEHRFKELNIAAGELANKAQKQANHRVYVAGCLPPLWRSYQPDMVEGTEQAEQLYTEFAANIDPYVDLYIAETMSTAEEAIGAAKAVARLNKPLWVAWTLRDDGTAIVRNGEDIRDIVAAVADFPVAAYLLNCCAPESISKAIAVLFDFLQAKGISKPIGGYANGFVSIPDAWQYQNPDSLPAAREDLDPEAYLSFVRDWLDKGASIVGGCCEIGPANIRLIREHLDGYANID